MSMDKVFLSWLRRHFVFKFIIVIMLTSAIITVAYQPPRKSVLEQINYWNRLRKVMYN